LSPLQRAPAVTSLPSGSGPATGAAFLVQAHIKIVQTHNEATQRVIAAS
jgi:hypothetical protein